MSDVFVFVSHPPIAVTHMGLMDSLDGLHGLLVHAQQRGSGGRREVKLADSSGFLLEVRVRAMHPHPNTVRPKIFEAQDSSYLGFAQPMARCLSHRISQGLVRPNLSKRGDVVVGAFTGKLNQSATHIQWNPRGASRSVRVFERCH